MSLLILHLNDHGIMVGSEQGILARSPGCLLARDNRVQFGDEAAAGSRLHPVGFHDRFWYELDMEPLSRPYAHFRHHADMAHAHLMHLAGLAGLEPDQPVDTLVFAPGTFDRSQLAVLLGILRHSPFRAMSLVDAAVVGAAPVLNHEEGLHLDIHQHQMVATELVQHGDAVSRQQAIAVPGLGWHQLENALAALVNEAFVRQARFNPQHSAEWEQQLHDRLPEWLWQPVDDNGRLIMTLNADGVRYQAHLTRDDLEQRLRGLFQRLPETTRISPAAELLLTERCSTLPGLRSLLAGHAGDGAAAISDERLLKSGLSLSASLRQDPEQALQFLYSVRGGRRGHTRSEARRRDTATHLLQGDLARPLRVGGLRVDGNGRLTDEDGPDTRLVGEVRAADGHYVLEPADGTLRVNGRPAESGQVLHAGDRLEQAGTGSSAQELRLIRVHDGG